MKKSKPPNFILFITDQQQAAMLGCYGHELVRTKNIDRLAEGGTRFDRFYVATPSCMPNRASLITGRMPSAHGLRVNGIGLPKATNTFVELLRAGGYATALVGKGHLQPMVDHPPADREDKRVTGRRVGGRRLAEARKQSDNSVVSMELQLAKTDSRRLPYYGFEHLELCTGHGDLCGADYERWLLERDPRGFEKMGPKRALKHDYICPQAWRTALPPRLYPTSYVADRATAYLTERMKEKDDRPFFLCVSFPDPHHPFTPPGKYWSMYAPDDVRLPANFSGGKQPPPHLAAALDERRKGSARLDGYGAVKLTEREAREAIALTCGMISMIDDAIGSVLRSLKSTSAGEDTVLIFTSDHGDLLGDHGLMLKGPLHYQSLIRVPFVWHDTVATQSPISQRLASTIDIAPTILQRAGIRPYNGMQGKSLLRSMEVSTCPEDDQDAVLIEDEQQGPVLCFESATRVRTLVTRRHRISIFSTAEWGELYDLEADPYELTNLWDDPEIASLKCELMERMARAMMTADDCSPAPNRLA